MPRGDGTGPMGAGPMTGRALGYCAGYAAPGFANSGFGGGMGRRGGFGRGVGRGMGFRRGFGVAPAAYYPPANAAPALRPEDEKKYLKEELEYIEKEKDALKARLAELDASKKNG